MASPVDHPTYKGVGVLVAPTVLQSDLDRPRAQQIPPQLPNSPTLSLVIRPDLSVV